MFKLKLYTRIKKNKYIITLANEIIFNNKIKVETTPVKIIVNELY